MAKTSMCEICCSLEYKYKCPGCGTKTCSLGCVRIHKEQKSCNGKRKVTEFVKLTDYNGKILLDDMNLLEDTTRKLKCTGSTSSSQEVSNLTSPPDRYASVRCSGMVLAKLVKSAAIRNIDLKLAPFMTVRRKANSTYCNARNVHKVSKFTKMYWHIRWVFDVHQYEEKSVTETIPMSSLIERFSSVPAKEDAGDSTMDRVLFYSAMKNSNFSLQGNSEAQTDTKGIIGMVAEHKKQVNSIYVFNPDLSLRENLTGKTVVEHPILLLISEGQLSKYTVVE